MSNAATIESLRTTDLRGWQNPALVLAAAVLLGHAPLAVLHLWSLWQQEQYQYFPFVIAASAYFLWSRWQQAPDTLPVTRRWARLPQWIAAAAVILLVGAILVVSPWLAFVSLNIGLAAVFALLNRQRAIPYLWGIWMLLWLLVPLPLGLDNRLVRYLQHLSSQLSSTILDLFGILHLMSGNVLQLPAKKFFVDEACSGIISVMSMIACAAIFAVWKNRSFFHLVALVLAGLTWALVLNVFRICMIAIAYHFFDYDLSTGAVHLALGLVLFAIMFVALASTDKLLLLMLAPIDVKQLRKSGQDNLLVSLWNRTNGNRTGGNRTARAKSNDTNDISNAAMGSTSQGMKTTAAWAVPFLILGVVQLIWLPSPNTAEAAQALQQALALDDQSLPQTVGPWILESFDTVEREVYSDFGKYSRNYRYRHNRNKEVVVTVSLDFPYLGGWHDLCVCYRNIGWTLHDRVVEARADSPLKEKWKYVVGDLEDPALGKAYVSFAGFDASGEAAEPASDAVLFRPWFRLRRKLLRNVAPQLFQVQVFAPMNTSEDSQLKQELRQLLLEARQVFRGHVAVTKAD